MKSLVVSGGMSWTRVSVPRWLSLLAKVLYAVNGLGQLALTLESLALGAVGAMCGALAFLLFIASYIVSLSQTSFAGSLEILEDHVVVQAATKRRVIARQKILSAMVVERPVFGQLVPTVEIELVNGDTLVARLPDRGSAGAVVEALGFGTGGARVHATLAKPTRRLLHPLVGFACYLATISLLAVLAQGVRMGTGVTETLSAVGMALAPVLGLALYALLRRFMRAPEITAGDDGVLVTHRLRTRFLPARDIALVSAAGGTALVIETRAGGRFRIGGVLVDDARRSAIARVIDERAGPAAAGADRFAHYARAGRALPEWRAHLAHAMNEGSYRGNAATIDEAAGVLRSAQATPEQRVGAALALRIAGEPKERIRVAVEGAADPDVREALEAVAESDDDTALEKALRRLG